MKACLQGMAQEPAFLDALPAAVRRCINSEQLDLPDWQGLLVAQFESRYLQ